MFLVFSFDSSSFEVARNGSMHEELVLVVNDNEEKLVKDPFPLRVLMIYPIQ